MSIIARLKYPCFSILLMLSVWRDSTVLFQSAGPVGLDGYYYVLQVNSLLGSGKLYFSSFTPLCIYFFTLLSLIVGDTVFSIKIGALALQLFLITGIFAVIFEITKHFWTSLFGMAIAAFSNLHFYYIGEFLSNLAALVFILWGVFGFIRYRHKLKIRWLVFSLACLLSGVLCHRSAILLVAILLYSTTTAYCLLSCPTRARALAIIIFLVLFFSPSILGNSDLALFTSAWFSEPLWNSPGSPFFELGLAEKWVLVIVFCVGLSQLPYFQNLLEQSILPIVFVTITLISVLFSLNPLLNHSSGPESIVGRLDTLVFLQVAFAAPILTLLLAKESTQFSFLVSLIVAGLIGWSASKLPTSQGLAPEYLRAREALVHEIQPMRQQLCDDPIVIAPHGTQFLISAVLNVPSQKKPPTTRAYGCVYWLVRQNERVSLLNESEVKSLIASIDRSETQGFLSTNPHLAGMLSERSF